jgi:ubiquinone/menaquinone biosynthesis C-methylase UbiE
MATAFFDRVASRYDELWTNTDTGRLQRAAVWRYVDPLFPAGAHILDIGCGTGEDAVHFAGAGVRITAFDPSPEMVRLARNRSVDAQMLAIEELSTIEGIFDGALSNFGALNCVADPAELRPLARLIRPGGHLAICVIGRFCLRESVHFLRRGQIRKAVRRWNGVSRNASLKFSIYYPTIQQIRRLLAPDFVLSKAVGIGVCVPPSYISTRGSRTLPFWERIDRHVAHRRFFRALSDHRLLIFRRK